MISVLLTAYREPDTIGPALDAFLSQLPPEAEIVVVCPDEETTAVINRYAQIHPQIHHIPDHQQGKPAAINLGLTAVNGDIIILSDGDVCIQENAVPSLLAPFENSAVGAVTGQPVSISPRQTMLGYWSHLLVNAAHVVRQRRAVAGDFLLCSGYLFAYRKALLPQIPEDALAEDAVISHHIAEQGHIIAYAPDAKVAVKYPTTYRDWLRQKVRSAGGYAQDYIRHSPVQMRSAWREFVDGPRLALTFARSPRELMWTMLLFAARLHLWLLVFWRVRVEKRPLTQLWQRVETTK